MKLSEVCIDRPVFATVLSLLIVLFGLIGVTRLPNRELPNIADRCVPPNDTATCSMDSEATTPERPSTAISISAPCGSSTRCRRSATSAAATVHASLPR